MWEWFLDLFNSNGVGFGPFRIEFQEIEAYARITRITIEPWQALLIRDLCEVYMQAQDEKEKRKKHPPPKGTTKVTSMKNTSAVRALFLGRGEDGPKKKTGSRPGAGNVPPAPPRSKSP